MLQRFRNLVEDVIEVTRVQGSAMATTIDEVKRVLTKGEGAEAASVPQSGSSNTIEERRDGTMDSPAANSTSSRDEDKNLLKDLFDLRNFSLSTKPNDQSSASTVQVRQISSRKYKDSDSSEDSADDGGSAQYSSHSGGSAPAAFRQSDSCRGSIHTNTSSSFVSGNEASLVASENEFDYDECTNTENPDRLSVDWECSNSSQSRSQSREATLKAEVKDSMRAERSRSTEPAKDRQNKRNSGSSVVQVHHQNAQSQHLRRMDPEIQRSTELTSTDLHLTASKDNECEGIEGRGSWSSAASSSMPSIAITMAANSNEKSSGAGGSEEESEDIGEVFAAYGARKANSQTNLSKLSPFSKKRMGLRVSSRESIVSCYSNAGEENSCTFPVTGEILFGLNYNYRQSVLEVSIKQCKGLAPVDQKKNHSDPYVKTYLLPDRTKNGKRKTRIKKHSLNPVFDEVLKYHVTKSELETRTLSIAVLHNDRFGRNDFLGEIVVPLDYYSFDNPAPVWHKLQDRPHQPWDGEGKNGLQFEDQSLDVQRHDDSDPSPTPLSMLTYKGDLSVCLKFVSAEYISGKKRGFDEKGELHVIVKEARNLTAVRTNGYSDPFCKGYLLPDKSHDSKRKSPVIRRNCNPKWNHTFVFENVSWDDLQERSLELTIWDHDRLTTNDFLGGVRLNLGSGKSDGKEVSWMDSTPEEAGLWQAMLDRPNCWIEGTLLLRIHMNQRK